mmetsp:Transcript_61910/g.156580  ORF Transcript_61910/g.156580 Transcript_61910/m.156580 type:complete len:246 (+) Transcript_61910:384-1121(+)
MPSAGSISTSPSPISTCSSSPPNSLCASLYRAMTKECALTTASKWPCSINLWYSSSWSCFTKWTEAPVLVAISKRNSLSFPARTCSTSSSGRSHRTMSSWLSYLSASASALASALISSSMSTSTSSGSATACAPSPPSACRSLPSPPSEAAAASSSSIFGCRPGGATVTGRFGLSNLTACGTEVVLANTGTGPGVRPGFGGMTRGPPGGAAAATNGAIGAATAAGAGAPEVPPFLARAALAPSSM